MGKSIPKQSLPRHTLNLFYKGISTIQIKYRYGGDLKECTNDLLDAINHVDNLGIHKAGLLGWSFGGAVVCQAAEKNKSKTEIKAIATLATQSYGVDLISKCNGVASLFIHGTDDTCLSTKCSEYTYKIAEEPKKLILVEDHHGFDSTGEELQKEIVDWFEKYLI